MGIADIPGFEDLIATPFVSDIPKTFVVFYLSKLFLFYFIYLGARALYSVLDG